MQNRPLTADMTALQDSMEIPGLGVLPVNAFFLRSQQPLLIDTGLPHSRDSFLAAVAELVDLDDLRWIWLSHPDRDHTGSLYELLELAPRARVVTTFMGVGILSIERPLPLDRVHLLNPGQSLDLGDRTITAFRPPVFDSPATTGFVDDLTGTAFSSDCFGAPLASAELAGAGDVSEVPADELAAGQGLWAHVDSPWLAGVDRTAFRASLEPLRALDPPLLLSSHLPPATGRAGEFLDRLGELPDFTPFAAPDQAALEEMLRQFEPPTQRSAEVPAAV
jgi:glyoxylase-like metal-dependent hydrolase (beta-lactamase superfamily II)